MSARFHFRSLEKSINK